MKPLEIMREIQSFLRIHRTVRFQMKNHIRVYVQRQIIFDKRQSQTCLANAAEVTEHAKQFELGRCVFVDLHKQKSGIARARTNHTEHAITSSGK